VRILKILLSIAFALFCIVYAAQNVANIEQAYGAVGYVLGNVDHVVYPASIGPSITSPVLLRVATWIIIAGEFLAGLLALKGAWDLWAARSGDAAAFQAAKRFVNLGFGVGLLVWFGLFQALGGALFQQWQTEIGGGSLEDAGIFLAAIGALLLFLNLAPDD